MLPLLMDGEPTFQAGEYLFIPGIRKALLEEKEDITAYVIGKSVRQLELRISSLTQDERLILLAGSLINFYKEIPHTAGFM